eukprot:gene16993-22490_t
MIKQQVQTPASGLRSMDSKHKSLTVLRCKLVIIGDACVGKSSLLQVFQSGGTTYPKNYMMTVGADFNVKQVPIPDTNIVVELYIFDCAGQPIFNQLEMNSKYYENAAAVVVVYDIGNQETLQSTTKWLTGLKSAVSNPSDLIGVLIGNKSDYRDGSVDSRAEVVKEDAQRFSKDLGLAYFEASAASNVGVTEPFLYVATEFYKRYEDTLRKADKISRSMKHE